ncbi:SCO family protein [Marinigracilibium pacificum]|uniref:SCO family protein n=1 Tax=Marinigracilibium pacificum TaxID=2729599 RepID=A0A848J129_9BACT|nr:SCO family protein [Marinigracilibium pacificum]NMM49516.1 SCO family protein [Marinigracilibium pacificum]
MLRKYLFAIAFLLLALACNKGNESGGRIISIDEPSRNLGYIGNYQVIDTVINDEKVVDTIYHTIGEFSLIDQDSNIVTKEQMDGKVVVADFFFTTCPSICPTMAAQMLRVYEKYNGRENFQILSHSIDPYNDSVPALKDYANKLGVENDKWLFMTGDLEEIFRLAEKQYMITAYQDPQAPGGFAHSGAFVLVDQKGRPRGMYDGTKKEDVDRLMNDIDKLLTNSK